MLPERNCQTCTSVKKELWGCAKDAVEHVEIDGEVFKRCPRLPLLRNPELYSELFWLYSNYKRGILPDSGALYDQSAKYIFLMRYIESVLSECEAYKAEEITKKEEKQRRHNSATGGLNRVGSRTRRK